MLLVRGSLGSISGRLRLRTMTVPRRAGPWKTGKLSQVNRADDVSRTGWLATSEDWSPSARAGTAVPLVPT